MLICVSSKTRFGDRKIRSCSKGLIMFEGETMLMSINIKISNCSKWIQIFRRTIYRKINLFEVDAHSAKNRWQAKCRTLHTLKSPPATSPNPIDPTNLSFFLEPLKPSYFSQISAAAMPPSSAEARARWSKRKREYAAARKYKLKESENLCAFEDNEDDDDPDMDTRPTHLHTEDDPHIQSADRITHMLQEKDIEKLGECGWRICEFPVVIKRVVIRPHLSVLEILEAERAARNGERRVGVVAALENISYGQLQALSSISRDNPVLSGIPIEETARGSRDRSKVITPPRIAPGSGVIKRLGRSGPVHVVPVHSDWFSPNSVHRLERQVVPYFFSGRSAEHTPEKYMAIRNFIVASYLENPEKHLSVVDCQGLLNDTSLDDLTRIVRFLNHWGIINYCSIPPKHDMQKDEKTCLCEDLNHELCVPSIALKFIDSLILFEKPKCGLKETDVYPELALQHDEDSDFDSSSQEQLSVNQCSCCSRSTSAVYYQSVKEVDTLLCMDCFHEGRFIMGHSSLDFVKADSLKDFGDVDGDCWNYHETLLLLEGTELYKENWNKIAEHVGSKSKAQCILHFVRLPLDDASPASIGVLNTSRLSKLMNHDGRGKSDANSFRNSLRGGDFERKFPFKNVGNPVMCLVTFLASALGPRVAAACAHESLAVLSKDGALEGSVHGEITNSKKGPMSGQGAEGTSLSAEKVLAAAKYGLSAAALKAKLFADHEECEIQQLSANIINYQLKRLELKLKQFAEAEILLMRECEQMERTRQRIAAERSLVMSAQFGATVISQTVGLSAVGSAILNGNSMLQIRGTQQPLVSRYHNNQPIYPHLSPMQLQGMYGLGPRPPTSSGSDTMFDPSYSPSSLGHQLLGSFIWD